MEEKSQVYKNQPQTLLRKTKRGIVIGIGFTILGIGVTLLVLPGPAILVITLGLTILASELIWARRLLTKIKNTANRGKEEQK